MTVFAVCLYAAAEYTVNGEQTSNETPSYTTEIPLLYLIVPCTTVVLIVGKR